MADCNNIYSGNVKSYVYSECGNVTTSTTSTTSTLIPTSTTTSTTTSTSSSTSTSTSSTTSTTTTATTFNPNVVPIGNQIWISENLDVTTYRDGTVIPQVTDPTTWNTTYTGAWCYYNFDPANGPIYGKLYNWYAVNDPRGLAPVGYHIPTDAEWDVLINYLGGLSVAGGKMKETGLSHWLTPNTGATNSSGFTALGGGRCSSNGIFYSIKGITYWWSSTEDPTLDAFVCSLYYNSGNAFKDSVNQQSGLSVRLIQD